MTSDLYALEVTPDTVDGGFTITCPSMPGYSAHIKNLDNVIHYGRQMIYSRIVYLLSRKLPIPLPVATDDAAYLVDIPAEQAAEIAAYNASLP
jgi:hypothetical protein